MSCTFRTTGPRESLHLNNTNTGRLLDALGYPKRDELRGELPAADVQERCERYIDEHRDGGRPKIDWSVDPDVADSYEGARRLRSLANRSDDGVIQFS